MSFQPLGLKNTVWPTSGSLPFAVRAGTTTLPDSDKPVDATHWNPSWGFTAGQIVSNLAEFADVGESVYDGAQLYAPQMQKQRLMSVKLSPNTAQRKYDSESV